MNITRKITMVALLGGLLIGCNNNKQLEKNDSNIENSSVIIEGKSNSLSSESQSIIEKTNAETVAKNEFDYVFFEKDISIYLNPSVQYNNSYASNLGNEGNRMNEISNILEKLFKDNTNLSVYCNNSLPGLALSESVNESNNYGVDYHLALHSNAGGGKGSEGWYTKNSYNLTSSIINSLQEILPYPTRGLKDGSKNLYELKNTKATACLIEILFHDDLEQATYIVNHNQEIAKAIYSGVINYLKDV